MNPPRAQQVQAVGERDALAALPEVDGDRGLDVGTGPLDLVP